MILLPCILVTCYGIRHNSKASIYKITISLKNRVTVNPLTWNLRKYKCFQGEREWKHLFSGANVLWECKKNSGKLFNELLILMDSHESMNKKQFYCTFMFFSMDWKAFTWKISGRGSIWESLLLVYSGKKNKNKTEHSIHKLWDNIKYPNVQIIGSFIGEERKNR